MINDQRETDQDTILAVAKAAWLKHWEHTLNAEDIEAELRRPMQKDFLASREADRTQAEYLHQKARDALRQCLALQARMDCDRYESFKRWECAQYVTRFGRIEADGTREIEPHPGFLAQSSARGWR